LSTLRDKAEVSKFITFGFQIRFMIYNWFCRSKKLGFSQQFYEDVINFEKWSDKVEGYMSVQHMAHMRSLDEKTKTEMFRRIVMGE
jgi:hypothetical protein